jgi:hypothetical protein
MHDRPDIVVAGLIEDAGFVPVDVGGTAGCAVMEAPRRAGAVYGEEYREADAAVVVEAVRAGRPIPPTPRYWPALARAAVARGARAWDLLPVRYGLWSLRAGLPGGLTAGMFVSEERALDLSFDGASSRLTRLVNGGGLRGVSESAYLGGAERLMRVGPLGDAPGVSRLVRVRTVEPVHRDGMMTVGLRWEAEGVTGGLFPVLDADIRLSADGDESVRVALTGSYRPPLGALGTGLDRLLLRTVATATIRALLARIAAALEGDPAAKPG